MTLYASTLWVRQPLAGYKGVLRDQDTNKITWKCIHVHRFRGPDTGNSALDCASRELASLTKESAR